MSIPHNKLPCYVSRNIHKWIDLVFGYKQRGKTAELSNNLFYHLCYEGAVDMEKIHDLEERYALEVQIGEFGQVPKQLFASPHPARIIFEGKRQYNLLSLTYTNSEIFDPPSPFEETSFIDGPLHKYFCTLR